ncbi:MAG TPA: hypothetical protein VGG31_09005 [Candidatus Dormibacteraeota bacterium]|jgi:hypothetical protein
MAWLLVHLYGKVLIFWMLLFGAVGGAVVGAYIMLSGQLSSHDVRSCLTILSGAAPAGSTCTQTAFSTLDTFRTANNAILGAVSALPLVLGVFMAAPFMARELERGTHRLLWTQSVSPIAWLVKRSFACLGFALGTLSFVAIATVWWLSLGSVIWLGSSWPGFDLWFPSLVAYGLFAVALGLAAGTILGRTVISMAVTAGCWIAVRALVEVLLRPRFIPPVLAPGMTASSAGSNWFMSIAYIDSRGNVLSPPEVSAIIGNGNLESHGIIMAGVIQPASRFWIFQGIEAGIFLLLALVCLILSFLWVRYHLASR